jgi:hypothetical protein
MVPPLRKVVGEFALSGKVAFHAPGRIERLHGNQATPEYGIGRVKL